MARLEIDIALNNLQGATTGLKTLQDSLKQLSGKGVKIEVGGSAIAEAKVQAIQATTAIKEMVASANVNNATFLTKVKAEGIEAKTAVTQLSGELISSKVELEKQKSSLVEVTKAGKELDNQNKVTRNSIAKLTEQTKLYALEQKKLRNEQGSSKPLNEYQKLSRELTAVRNEAKNVGAQMYKLMQTGQQTTPVFQKLEKEFNDLKNKSTQLDSGLKTIDGSLGQFQRNVGNYEGKMANANGVTMEFNRIIQDAPFGMMGIGNNIQQLAANWQIYSEQAKRSAAETGKTIGTMGLMRGVMAQFLTTGNLITFGIAAITSAWTAYSMNVKKSSDTTEKLNNQFATQIGQLKNITALTERSAKTERDKATAVSEYNKELGDTLGKVSTYTELEKRLIENGAVYVEYLQLKAKAEATYQLSIQNTIELLKRQVKLENGQLDWYEKAAVAAEKFMNNTIGGKDLQGKVSEKDLAKILGMPTEAEVKAFTSKYVPTIQNIVINAWKANKKSNSFADLGSDYTQQANKIADALGTIKMPDLNLDKGNKARDLKDKTLPAVVDYLQQIKDLLSSKEQDLSLIDLNGQARDLQELSNKYADFYTNLDKLRKKYNADKNKNKQSGVIEGIDSATKLGEGLEDKETLAILDKWSKEYNKLIEETYQKAGFTAISSREKDLANFQSYIDKQRELAISYGGALEDVSESMRKAFDMGAYNINIQWNDKDLAEWGAFNDKIQELLDKPFNGKNKESIQRELDKRIELLKTAYEKLARSMNTPFDETEWARIKQEIELKAKVVFDDESKRAFKDFLTSVLSNAYTELFSNLKTNVEEFGSNFRSILFSVSETVQGSINKINTENINKVFEKFKDGGWSAASSMEKAAAGLAVAGNLVSSLSSKTSAVGQGVGGALSGAAAGASFGPWGAAIGGAIGLVSGIIGAKKQKKQEEMQRKQLEEQKKANALLERMNALAYTSSIIGGQSQYGIVSGVNRNAQGEFTFKIDGRDLVAVMGNNERLIGR